MEHADIQQLELAIDKIWDLAQQFGLDPYPVHFEVVPASIMYEFGAYGLPGRFSHWTHGRAYQQIKTMYDYGLSKIYELVINANPSEAFLLENNSVLQNKLVAAHVLGHVDFFHHNAYFQPTNRQMIETVSLNADRIRQYEFAHGTSEVEDILDAALSIQDHVDPNPRRRHSETLIQPEPLKAPTTPYDDLFALGEKKPVAAPTKGPRKLPIEADKDLLGFIADHAHALDDWQRDVIQIVRAEQLYFVPQMQTKIMNEGWASFWHARILRELDLSTDEYIEFSQTHSGVLAPSRRQINPYYVGMKIFENIERHWDQPTKEEQERGRAAGQGRAKIFEIREMESDASFLRNYLTEELVEELDLYLYRLEDGKWVIVDKDWENVRDTIVASLTNFGSPYIVVEDGDYRGNGELYLRHCYEGAELDQTYADHTLRYVQRLWGRPVHLETIVKNSPIVLSCDGHGSQHRTQMATPVYNGLQKKA